MLEIKIVLVAGNSPPVKTLVLPGVDNKPWRRRRFSKIKIWTKFASVRTLARAGVDTSMGGVANFSKIKIWPRYSTGTCSIRDTVQ